MCSSRWTTSIGRVRSGFDSLSNERLNAVIRSGTWLDEVQEELCCESLKAGLGRCISVLYFPTVLGWLFRDCGLTSAWKWWNAALQLQVLQQAVRVFWSWNSRVGRCEHVAVLRKITLYLLGHRIVRWSRLLRRVSTPPTNTIGRASRRPPLRHVASMGDWQGRRLTSSSN